MCPWETFPNIVPLKLDKTNVERTTIDILFTLLHVFSCGRVVWRHHYLSHMFLQQCNSFLLLIKIVYQGTATVSLKGRMLNLTGI